MKHGIFLAGVLMLSAVPAFAADMPVKARPMAPPVAYDWTGFYIGGNIGGKWDDQNSPITLGPVAGSPDPRFTVSNTLPFGARSSSFIGGGQIGYNWQIRSWVFGVEGDFDGQSLVHSTSVVTSGLGFVAGDTFSSRSDWQASARLRLGYAWGPWLAYVTGGAAFTDVRLSTNFVGAGALFPPSVASNTQTLVGGTIGGGFEYMINRNLSLGVEGRYSDYGTESYGLGSLAIFSTASGLPLSNVSSSARLNTWEVTGRLNYHWNNPVVAKY
jgi:outer membrane immunogenic protein